MDQWVAFNRERWEELSALNVGYAVPWLTLDRESARRAIDPEGELRPLVSMDNLDVLCLAASGGQQSAAFGILGARVTVFDLSENQLSKDRLAARHYGFPIETIQGDMQDLSVLRPEAFDLVWLAHAINFVPDARGVLRGHLRHLRLA